MSNGVRGFLVQLPPLGDGREDAPVGALGELFLHDPQAERVFAEVLGDLHVLFFQDDVAPLGSGDRVLDLHFSSIRVHGSPCGPEALHCVSAPVLRVNLCKINSPVGTAIQ